MGKKSREKRERKAQDSAEAGLSALLSVEAKEEIARVTGSGDLRLIPAHIEAFIGGREEAENALRMLGRDAAGPVARAGEELDNEDLRELAKRMVATRPVMDTNLFALREVSVLDLIERFRSQAIPIEGARVEHRGSAVAFFDPQRHSKGLARGGKPRADAEAIAKGELAWFLLAPDESVELELTLDAAPADAAALRLRLVVESGIVFVGSPEASDGPRFGEVRLDPFRTRLDEEADRGSFLELDPGAYELAVRRVEPGRLRVHFEPAQRARIDAELTSLVVPEASA